jgi:pimeloyl-ACP methyl ester carboxylesterase
MLKIKGWLAPALAVGLLLSDGPADGDAPRSTSAGAQVCPSPSLSWADCSRLIPLLARFADAAYADDPTVTPPDAFRPAALPGLPIRAGRYTNGSATALVMVAQLDQRPALVVGFGGSEDPATWLADLRDIDAPYRQFQPLVRAVEQYAAAGGKVILVGHSFGGAMVQLFMFAHPKDDSYLAVTFGSPGARPAADVFAARPDPRIANYVIADDPFVFLGEHRADVAAYARRNRIYALALAGAIASESGLSFAQIATSEPYLSANYVNNGSKVVVRSLRPGLSVPTVIGADPDEHAIETYVKLLGSASG